MEKAWIDAARCLRLPVSRRVLAAICGHYRSIFKGTGLDFEELRAYVPGEDIRLIDWRVSARMREPFIRRYGEERQNTLWLLLDASGSMRDGPAGAAKWETARSAAGLLALVATLSHDPVGLLIFTDRIEALVPPGRGWRHFHRLLNCTENTSIKGKCTDLAVALEALSFHASKNQLAFLLSDFQASDVHKALHLAARRLAIHAICLEHPIESRLPALKGLLRLRDTETGHSILLDAAASDTHQHFEKKAARLHQDRDANLHRAAIPCLPLSTEADLIETLAGFLAMLGRSGGQAASRSNSPQSGLR